jgi:hypothetical protein
MADAAQPSHAPFFAPLRDIDLPSPLATLAGAHEAPSSFAPWVDDGGAAGRAVWLDPLIPPDMIWADRPVPTPAWLASTLPPEAAAVSAADTPVAASTASAALAPHAAGVLEPSTEAGMRPPEALDTATPIEDAALLSPTVTTAGVTLPAQKAEAALSDFGPNRQAGSTVARSDAADANAGPLEAAHAAANALVPRDGAEFPAVVTAVGVGAVETDIHRLGAEPAAAPPGGMPPTPAQPVPRDEAPSAAVPSLMPAELRDVVSAVAVPPVTPAAAPLGGMPPVVPADLSEEVPSAAVPPAQTTRQPSAVSAEGRLPAVNKVVDAHAGETPPTAYGTSSPTEAAPGRLELDARPVLRRPEADFAPLAEDPGSGLRQQGPQDGQQHRPQHAEGEPRSHLAGEMASTTASVQPILPQRAGSAPDQDGTGRGAAPAAPQTGQPTAAVPPAVGIGGPQPVPGPPSPIEPVPPQAVPALRAKVGAAAGMEGQRAPAATASGIPAAMSHDTHTRDVPAVQAANALDVLVPARTQLVQPVATHSTGRGAAMSHDTPLAARAAMPGPAAKQQEQRAAGEQAPQGHAQVMRPLDPARTTGSLGAVQRAHATPTEPPPTLSGESPEQASAARPVTAAPGQANARPAPEIVTASALLQPRNQAEAGPSIAHPMVPLMAAAQAPSDRPAVQPRLTQAVSAAASAGPSGRYVEPQVLPTVHVTVGRIEVRFATPGVEQVPPARQPSRQNLPLNAILQRDVWGAA